MKAMVQRKLFFTGVAILGMMVMFTAILIGTDIIAVFFNLDESIIMLFTAIRFLMAILFIWIAIGLIIDLYHSAKAADENESKFIKQNR